MIETAADRVAMLSDWDSATWNSTAISGIFKMPYQDVFGVTGSQNAFITDASLVPGIAVGDTMTINSAGYVVRAIEPDGTGLLRLVLEEQ